MPTVRDKMKFILVVLAVVLGSSIAQDSPQQKTNVLIDTMINTFGEQFMQQWFPCTQYANCSSCTAYSNCVWIIGSTTVGLYVTRVKDNTNIIQTSDTSFCWVGNGAGITQNNVASQTTSGDDTIATTNAGFNDFLWSQCRIRSGAAIVIGIVVPIVVIIVVIICCIVTCVCCKHWNRIWKKEDREKMLPKEDRKKRWLARFGPKK